MKYLMNKIVNIDPGVKEVNIFYMCMVLKKEWTDKEGSIY
jgi:hypothetical protein